LYREGRYLESYDLITEQAESPDAIPALVYYFRFSFACRAGLHDLALSLLREAIIDRGFWYSPDHLGDEDLEPLRGLSEFNELVEISAEREGIAARDARSEMEIVLPGNGGDKRPALVVALHGNQFNIRTTRLNWNGEALSDCLLAFPQSSHAVCTDAYSWVGPGIGSEELVSHLDEILTKNHVDRDRTILGGFSAGGRVVLHTILKRKVKAKGIILLGPWLPDLVSLEPLIPNLRSAGVRVYLMCGDHDEDCFDSSNRLAELLEENGVSFQHRVVAGMGHSFPPDFEEYLAKARTFILEGEQAGRLI
jgi:pimeloyl-ACP methyl ester carboxylesterase